MGVLRIAQGVQRAVGKGPNSGEDHFWPVKITRYGGAVGRIGKEWRNAEPEEASALGRPRDERMVDEFHQPLAPRFVSRFDKNCPDGMDTEGLFVSLLVFDELVVSTKLPQHIGNHHRAAVTLVEEVGELLLFWAILEAQRKESIRFDWHSLSLISLLPKELTALLCGPDLRHFGLVAGDLAALTPGLKRNAAARFPACHLDHEMHPRDHQPMVQKPELHMLATNGRACVVLLAVATDLFEHLRVDFKVAPLGQQVERLAAVQVISRTRCGCGSRGTPSESPGHAPTVGANVGG